ncbi:MULTISPECIES: hypothetical protein [unclassified Exiguobacterium]|uniref:hypothetical protein n=1 Tax=unclassified Exiguobacterium TaxID=2644629 RepID=UPI001BEA7F8D|nr:MULTISPECIES: hypothetical protein [unclassified Exiguobacterium]
MRKKLLLAFLLFNPIVFLIGWWNGEWVMITVAGFGVIFHALYQEQLEQFDEEKVKSLMQNIDSKLISSIGFLSIFSLFVVVWFFNEMTVPLLDTMYVVFGVIMTRRGLLIRSAVLHEKIDLTNVIHIKKTPSS